MSTPHARLTAVAVHLPDHTLTTAELEDRLAEHNPGLTVPRGLVTRFSGVRRRHLAPPTELPSDLAVAAARKLWARSGADPGRVDLLLYAGVCLDVLEPATGHVVAAKLGLDCPVIDVRNACNGVCNAIEIADAFIASGAYRTVLVACGETCTKVMPWTIGGHQEYVDHAAAFTLSDAGAALLLEADAEPGVLVRRFVARSAAWRAATVPLAYGSGGTRTGGFVVDGVALAEGVGGIPGDTLRTVLADHGLTWDDLAAVCVHQAALPALWATCDHFGIPRDKVVVTIADHGNVAAATLPLQLARLTGTGRVRRGDLVALVGVASGVSVGLVVLRW
ncbi:MAG TPA: ketoacyl-ACP synthase III [Thermomonospora sp.]|nr:ketoacyl-ACP synthase III [Thermomonospora sp.]